MSTETFSTSFFIEGHRDLTGGGPDQTGRPIDYTQI